MTKVGDENKVATVGDITNTINNTGWTTNNAKVIDANGNVVKDADGNDVTKSVVVNPGDQVNYVDGKGSTANITVTTDPATGKDTVNVAYDVNTGNITKAGDQDVKDAAGNVITKAGQVSVANGEGDKVATVQNVADAINSAGWIVNTGRADDKNMSFETEAGTAKKVSAGDKVNFQAGKNLEVKRDGDNIIYTTSKDVEVQTIVVTGEPGKDGKPGKDATVVVGQKGEPGQNGQPGKDGVDGSIGVNGKDGSAVVINGKDGSIGLNGKDGANGLTIKGEKGSVGVDGTDGKNGKDGMTRIVYTDDKGTKHEVATRDDGLKFTGNDNDTVNNHKLNSVVTVKGEGVDKAASKSFKSASGNINVKADGQGSLEVQLAKDLKGINSISNGKSSVTLNENGGTTIKGGDVNVDGNKITNVKAGTEPTDAVNVSQLRNNITNVNNRINKVSKEARGGIAGANAAAGLPQVYLPGKSMVAASAGTFKGENAFAVGYSRASDNGKLILKLQGNANSQGDVGGSVGVGYQW
ncbi:YadA family autotransporter adhesin [Rodentibacter ratti]|uniref:YadA family autotransporter adhesin n=1 Tax=Rodentibacter ratti TaxID=1906745 RepID=UPI00117B367F|nr:YadA-like family protein [Rodentibacter ratti]